MLNYKKLRKLRRNNELTMAELAAKAGYRSANSVWKLENSAVDVPLSRLEKLAALCVETKELLMEDPERQMVAEVEESKIHIKEETDHD